MSFILQHTRLGFCWLDLIALAVLIAVVVMFVIQKRKMNQEEKELQDQLSSIYAVKAVDGEKKD